ncbi:glycine zipper 2TM domain-containing protein [Sphingobium sp. AN558]|uniref:glycine zipper 2TM domain-containing protein n=1 Tax=Sphingobium sp. AN558 TaxID=3133442 RepID=UPI0030BDDAA1
MKRVFHIAALLATAVTCGHAPLMAQTAADERRFDDAQARFDRELQVFQDEYRRYQDARSRGGPVRSGRGAYYDDERDENGYDAARYYRANPNYRERVLSNDDRVYRGMDGRYYCKRNDGTTGLIVGGAAGGVLGNVIDGGRSRTVGTLLGAAAGALAGRAIEQQNKEIRCR